jgi:hypothetical protein
VILGVPFGPGGCARVRKMGAGGPFPEGRMGRNAAKNGVAAGKGFFRGGRSEISKVEVLHFLYFGGEAFS